MYAFATLASILPLLTTLTSAAPAGAPPVPATITLEGAADAQYTISVPFDGTWTPTNNPLSISHVNLNGGPCEFYGIDGLQLNVPEAGFFDVGPPQTILGVICFPS